MPRRARETPKEGNNNPPLRRNENGRLKNGCDKNLVSLKEVFG